MLDTIAPYLLALLPTVGVAFLFYWIVRYMIEADRRERKALAAWRKEVGSDGHVLTREELSDLGWVGALDAGTAGRFGDVVVSMRAARGYVDSRVMSHQVLALIGQHGAMTPQELDVPFLHLPPR